MPLKASRPRHEPKLRPSRPGSSLARYGVALFSAGLAILIRELLTPVWGTNFPFLTLFPAVLISSWYGGFGPGLMTTVLGALAAAYFWIPPTYSFTIAQPADIVGLLLAVSVMLLILFLTNALAQKTAELERSNAELQQFAYVASHDLQEPLRMVATFVDLLARRYQENLDAEAEQFIGYAIDGARRMKSLIDDLLAYSRVGAQKEPFGPVDCEDVLQRTLQNLRLAIEENQAIITHDPLPVVRASEMQVALLLQNLLSNALKFRNAALPRIHLSAQPHGAEWLFSVKDNGIGIDPRHAERIFVIFQRLHTRKEYPGTGLGLAICKKIIEQQGGRIWVESEPGKGATFFFTLPGSETIHSMSDRLAER